MTQTTVRRALFFAVMCCMLFGCTGSRPELTAEVQPAADPVRINTPDAPADADESDQGPGLSSFFPSTMNVTGTDGSVEAITLGEDDAATTDTVVSATEGSASASSSSSNAASAATETTSPTIFVDPADVAEIGEHEIIVTGVSFGPGETVVIVVCDVPGEPLATSTSSADLVRRVTQLNALEACDVERGASLQADDVGAFTVSLDGTVTTTTVVYAGPSSGNYAALATLIVGQ